MKRKGLAIICCLLVAFSAFFMGCERRAAGDGVTRLQLGFVLPIDGHYGMGLQEFARLAYLYSNGTVIIEIFPDGLLGNERDLIEGVGLGTVHMALSASGPFGLFFPEFQIIDMPFLFPTKEIAWEVLDGEIGQELLNLMRPQGIVGLAFHENGFRSITNNVRPIHTPADLTGLRIRTLENDIMMDAVARLGASPLPMAFGEVFMAMQQGVIDGHDNPALLIEASRFNEVQRYFSITMLFYSPTVIIMNERVYERLTAEQQRAIRRAATESAVWQRNFSRDNDLYSIERLRAAGMQVNFIDDFSQFVALTQGTYEAFAHRINQDWVRKIREIAARHGH